MIGKLTGLVDSSGEDWVILDVGGVGYLVFCSGRTLGLLPPSGGGATLWIETHVREDHIHLFGFADPAEHDWFKLLNSVQGVGAKMALAVLTTLPPHDLVRAIAAQDKASLSRANGVGPKLAGRIASELKDKAGGIALGPVAVANGVRAGEVSEDAISALVNLGYRRAEAFAAVAKASGDLGSGASVERLIKAGLKELAS
ncbi:MAG: Holliday junction branch migration protein RuvA [Kiloniellaceae bacterium]|nr:Holliday junction branch migration protein RuvA [Kiloniellaceae bacterium]